MCLITETNQPKVAQEDIHVYKIVADKGDGKTFESPVAHTTHNYDEELTTSDPLEIEKCEMGYMVEKGMFHCIKNPREDIQGVVRCTIPKGTEYFEDVNGDELCAKKVIVHKG